MSIDSKLIAMGFTVLFVFAFGWFVYDILFKDTKAEKVDDAPAPTPAPVKKPPSKKSPHKKIDEIKKFNDTLKKSGSRKKTR